MKLGKFAGLAASAILAGMLSVSPASAQAESSDPVRIAFSDWTTIQINSEIMARVLQKMGYNTEMVPSEYLAQIPAIENGDIDFSLEIWFTTAAEPYKAAVASGKGLDLGETGMQAIEEWWYPLYMKEKCPGLPDWQALNKCAELFATAETAPKGRYVGGPQSWGGYDDERAEALGLNFVVIHPGADAVINAEIKSAYERQAPVVAWVYVPNWTSNVYKGEFVEFPKYEDACYNDPAWGSNAAKTHDCGKPRGPIKKLGSPAFEKKFPKAAAAVRKFQMSNEVIGALATKVDVEGKTVAEVSEEWFNANEAVWKPWTE